MKKLTVHVILNSHLDPIWLWNLSQGIDEVIATARTACDALDDYPQVHITRGEAWFYEMVEKHDPNTFKRIQKHIANGRWHVVGNWYIQPDCNLGSPETYMKHAQISSEFFRTRFGIKQVQTGYNVDSFGHDAYLPEFYAKAGVKNYCFMRPACHEKELPNLFTWRSPSGYEILTARLREPYCCTISNVEEHLQKLIDTADRTVGHVMFFVGIGDHGGGPAREEIEWLIEHQKDYPNAEIRFSHPDAFFDAVRKSRVTLPVVTDELQHHAIGCYAATSRIKREIRRTENKLIQAEPWMTKEEHDTAWKYLLFATFHDVHAGTAIESAYNEVYDSLGAARTIAFNAVAAGVRALTVKYKPNKLQKVVLDNLGPKPFDGVYEFEPFVSFPCLSRHIPWEAIRLIDAKGEPLRTQLTISEAAAFPRVRLACHLDIPARSRQVLYIDYKGSAPTVDYPLTDAPVTLDSLPAGKKNLLAEPLQFQVFDDQSDTWSHGLRGFSGKLLRTFKPAGTFQNLQNGPLVLESLGKYTDSKRNSIIVRSRKEAGLNGIRLNLRINWQGAREILYFVVKPGFKVATRIDGVPGGPLPRKLDAEEWPMFNYTWLQGKKESLAVVTPDCFSCDVLPDGTLRVMLLRTPYYAHHDPYVIPKLNKYPVTDQGAHDYDIVLLANPTADDIERVVYQQTSPMQFTESTLGVNRTWYKQLNLLPKKS